MRATLAFLVFFFLSASVCWADDISPASIRVAKMSVVHIECLPPSAQLPGIVVHINTGSGFLVDNQGDFVTAYHVIQKMESPDSECNPSVIFRQGSRENQNEPILPVRIYSFVPSACSPDVSDDIVACRTTEDPFSNASLKNEIAPVTFETAQQSDGTEVAFTGFPSNYGQPVTAKGFIATSTPVNSRPTVTIDRMSWPGMSGAPVYTSNSKIIGIIVGGETGDDAGMSVARPASTVVNFLCGNNFPIHHCPAKSNSRGAGP